MQGWRARRWRRTGRFEVDGSVRFGKRELLREIRTDGDEVQALDLFHETFHELHLFQPAFGPPVLVHARFDLCAEL